MARGTSRTARQVGAAAARGRSRLTAADAVGRVDAGHARGAALPPARGRSLGAAAAPRRAGLALLAAEGTAGGGPRRAPACPGGGVDADLRRSTARGPADRALTTRLPGAAREPWAAGRPAALVSGGGVARRGAAAADQVVALYAGGAAASAARWARGAAAAHRGVAQAGRAAAGGARRADDSVTACSGGNARAVTALEAGAAHRRAAAAGFLRDACPATADGAFAVTRTAGPAAATAAAGRPTADVPDIGSADRVVGAAHL